MSRASRGSLSSDDDVGRRGSLGSTRSQRSPSTIMTSASNLTFPMPSDEMAVESVPVETVFRLLDRDNSGTIDVRDFATVLQALNPKGDVPLSALVHCFPNCVLRPRNADDERRLLAMLYAPLEEEDEEEVHLDFEQFANKWDAALVDIFNSARISQSSSSKEAPSPPHTDSPSSISDLSDTSPMAKYHRRQSTKSTIPPPPPCDHDGNPNCCAGLQGGHDDESIETINTMVAPELPVHPRERGQAPQGKKKVTRIKGIEYSSMKEPKTIPPPKNRTVEVTPENNEEEPQLKNKCSFRRRNFRRSTSVHADWEIDSQELKFGVQCLGGGKFGVVREATWRGAPVAVKKLKNSVVGLDDDATERFEKEAVLLANMRHPNVLMFMGAVMDYHGNKGGIMVVTERLDLSLHNMIYDTGLTRGEWFSVCEQICSGLNYLHLSDPPIIHRDINSAEIKFKFLYSAT